MIAEQKRALRQQMRRVRAGLDAEALAEAGARVADRVLAVPEVVRARHVLCYVAFRREVPTRGLIERLLAEGVEVAVPRVLGERVMEARRYQSPLVPDVWGIPTSDGPRLDTVAVSICPGLAFDAAGRRLGYGGGYYDTWLAAVRPVTIGVCVDEAFVEEVPAEVHDRRMDVVVTPSRTVYASQGTANEAGSTSR